MWSTRPYAMRSGCTTKARNHPTGAFMGSGFLLPLFTEMLRACVLGSPLL